MAQVESDSMLSAGDPLQAGDLVRVFYRADKQPRRFRFIATPSRAEGVFTPRHGLSDGWVSGQVFDFSFPKNKNETVRYFCEI